jgi:hypothetical protein
VASQVRQRTLPVDGLDVSAGGARLEVALQGLTESPHSVTLTLNGLAVGSVDFDGATPGVASISLPPGLLVPGDNVLGLVAPGAGDVSLEQYVRLVYPRLTMRGDRALDFTLEAGASARLAGFDASRTQVLDITDPDAPFRVAVTAASGAPAVLATGIGTRHLIAYLPEGCAAPVSVIRNQPSRWWASAGADLVVLGPAALFDAIRPLVDRRQSEGLSVALVDIEDVQDEFASGEKSVDAVRSFLARALTAWQRPPRYLLLLGAASYDPRDYLGLGGDLVPSAAVQTSEIRGGVRQLVRRDPHGALALRRTAPGSHRRRDPGGGGEDPRPARGDRAVAMAARVRRTRNQRLPGDDRRAAECPSRGAGDLAAARQRHG